MIPLEYSVVFSLLMHNGFGITCLEIGIALKSARLELGIYGTGKLSHTDRKLTEAQPGGVKETLHSDSLGEWTHGVSRKTRAFIRAPPPMTLFPHSA
jgi:hypothetical protein